MVDKENASEMKSKGKIEHMTLFITICIVNI